MEKNYISELKDAYRNKVLNATGTLQELMRKMAESNVLAAVDLMDNNDTEVTNAIQEYNPQTHKVMNRRDKDRVGKNPYISEKLPRTRARYINEIELFFLLGKPVLWDNNGDEECVGWYKDFIRDYHINARLRQVKRIAGAETECALVFHLTNDNGHIKVTPFVASRSAGYRLRTLFNQYGEMQALAYGYRLKEEGRSVSHWDVLTAEYNYYCRRGKEGWEVDIRPNITGKINAVYFQQPKAWDGAVPRIEREEMLDSKVADTNNYFADPIAKASADVIQSLADPDKPGKLIQMSGMGSQFEYVNPPQNSATRAEEKRELNDSILFDTFTPDFSFEKMRGMGSLSGVAIKNALILGYIKRDVRKETYEELVARMAGVIRSILKQLHPAKAKELDEMSIEFEFAEPFDSDQRDFWLAIASLYGSGVVSLETAVHLLKLTKAPDEEIDRILMGQMEQMQAQQDMKEGAAAAQQGLPNPQQTAQEQLEPQE